MEIHHIEYQMYSRELKSFLNLQLLSANTAYIWRNLMKARNRTPNKILLLNEMMKNRI